MLDKDLATRKDMRLTIIVLVLVALAVYGASTWRGKTKDFRAKLAAERLPITPTTYDARDIENLPPPEH